MAKTCNDSTACFSVFLGSGGCRGGDKKYSGRLGVLVAAPATKLGGAKKFWAAPFLLSENANFTKREHPFTQGANHSKKISYTLCENPIVLSENHRKSFCFRENLVRYLQE